MNEPDNFDVIKRFQEIESKLDALSELVETPGIEFGGVFEIPSFLVKIDVTDTEILNRDLGVQSTEILDSDLELRFAEWKYAWECDWKRDCATSYYGEVFVISKSTGRTMTWNLIESATRKDHGLPFWSTSPNYVFARNTSHVSFGIGTRRSGRSCRVSTCINCRADWGSISFRWDSSAC